LSDRNIHLLYRLFTALKPNYSSKINELWSKVLGFNLVAYLTDTVLLMRINIQTQNIELIYVVDNGNNLKNNNLLNINDEYPLISKQLY